MLVLSRKSNQSLHIGNDIVVTIVRVRGDVVRIGIEAPKDVKIMRNELLEKLVENIDASSNCSLQIVAPESESVASDDSSGEAKVQATDDELAGNCNPDEEPKSGGPLARFCKPQLRAFYANAT